MTLWKPKLSNCNKALTPDKARNVALTLLARREHSRLELRHKLIQRGFASPVAEAVLSQLVDEDLINESRYAEIYAHSRADRGYGPLRIQQELRERGISEVIILSTLDKLDKFWMSKLFRLHHKRWSSTKIAGAGDEIKRMRFLRHRGFTLEQIKQLFNAL